jgi:hypothetical protein
VNQKHSGSRIDDQKFPVIEISDRVTTEPVEMTTAFLDVKGNLGSPPPEVVEVDVPKVSESKHSSVSPPHDHASSSASLMMSVEEHENTVDINIPVCSKLANINITSTECSSVVEIPSDHSNTINEFPVVDNKYAVDFCNMLTNVGDSSFDTRDQVSIQKDNGTLTSLQTVLPQFNDEMYEAVKTDNNDSCIPAMIPETTEQFPKYVPLEKGSSTNTTCMQNKDPVPPQEKALVADKRKTVVEVCEKIFVDGGSTSGAVKSPPPTPYIEVPDTWVMPFQVSVVHTKTAQLLFLV